MSSGSKSTAADFAVLVPLIEFGREECVLLTQRTVDLPHYAGQVSFPGGAHEPGDGDLITTALRETHEEVGIPTEKVEILAELEWFATTLGHRVRPFVGKVQSPVRVVPNPKEVARVLYLPTRELRQDPFEIRSRLRNREGRVRTVYTMQFDGAEIWGLTARILRSYFVDRNKD